MGRTIVLSQPDRSCYLFQRRANEEPTASSPGPRTRREAPRGGRAPPPVPAAPLGRREEPPRDPPRRGRPRVGRGARGPHDRVARRARGALEERAVRPLQVEGAAAARDD